MLRDMPPVGDVSKVHSVGLELVPGRVFRVITLDQLIAVKAALTRPHDKDVERDLRAIRSVLEKADGSGKNR